MSADQETVDTYNKHILDYRELMSKEAKDTNLDLFMKKIVSKGKVLDLGCGTGSASLALLKRGLLPSL
jgi:tRNA1(Val) A37 N6-methylase TrmN6